MATIAFGGGVSDIRGSIGGTTFSRNRNGAYARARTQPINPGTSKQTEIRERFGFLATQWSELTAAQRLSWDVLGSQIVRLNRLGQPYTLSGQQAYNSVNQVRGSFGLLPTATPPALSAYPQQPFGGFVVDPSPADVVQFQWSTVPDADQLYLVYGAAPARPGINYFSDSAYKLLGAFTTDGDADTFDVTDAWEAAFGELDSALAGAKCSFKIAAVSQTYIRNAAIRYDTFALAS